METFSVRQGKEVPASMGVFYKCKMAMQQFMYGRNGVDQLNRVLIWVYIGCFLAETVFRVLRISPLVRLLDALVWLLVLVVFFRMFSKNLYKRREENQKFLNWQNRVLAAKARYADKEHKYFTCQKCKTICRVPVGKGKIVITCPKCGSKIQGKS